MKVSGNDIKHEILDQIILERWKAIRCLSKDIPVPGKPWSGSCLVKKEVADLVSKIILDPESRIYTDEPIVESESPLDVEEVQLPDMIPVLRKPPDETEFEGVYYEENDFEINQPIQFRSRQFLGSYSNMHSPGCIKIYMSTCMDLAMKFFFSWIKKARNKADYWSHEVFRWLSYATMIATYSHELFHHACDTLQHLNPYVRKPDPEEPLAVAFSIENTELVDSPQILSRSEFETLRNYFLKNRFSVDFYSYPYDQYENYFDNTNKKIDYWKLEQYIMGYGRHPLPKQMLSKLVNRIHDLHVEIVFGISRSERIFQQNPCQKI